MGIIIYGFQMGKYVYEFSFARNNSSALPVFAPGLKDNHRGVSFLFSTGIPICDHVSSGVHYKGL